MARDPTMADVAPVFERALGELKIPLPAQDHAIWTLLRYHIGRLASGALVGREGLKPILDVLYNSGLYDNSRQYVGDSHGLQHLVGIYWTYDDVPAAAEDLDIEARRKAQSWLDAHGA